MMYLLEPALPTPILESTLHQSHQHCMFFHPGISFFASKMTVKVSIQPQTKNPNEHPEIAEEETKGLVSPKTFEHIKTEAHKLTKEND